MKRLSVFALFVVLSMVLAACAGGGQSLTPTAEGGLGPSMTEVPGGTVPTEALPTEALPTEVVGPAETMPAGTAVGTNIPATGESDLNRLDNLLGLNVIDSQNNDLGEVNDMVVDSNGAQIRFVVLGTGGFLGIGENNVLLPWDMLTLGVDNNNNNAFIFNGDADAVRNAPTFDANSTDFTSADWDMQYNDYWNNLGTGTSVAGTPEPSMTEAVQPTAGAVSSTVTRGAAADFVLASKLVIADVLDRTEFNSGGGAAGTSEPGVSPTVEATAEPFSNDSGLTTGTSVAGTGLAPMGENVIGQVTDVIVDSQTGQVNYLVVDAGDVLNVGDKWIPVPLSQVDIVYKGDSDVNNILILADAQRLTQAPNFDPDTLPNTSTDGWDADLVTYWGVSS